MEKINCVLYKNELAVVQITYGNPNNPEKQYFSNKAMKELWDSGNTKHLVNSGEWIWKIKPLNQ